MEKELKTERLCLRPLTINDLEAVHTYSADPENTAYMLVLPNDSLEETRQFLIEVSAEWSKENPDYFEFAITLNEAVIGALSLYLYAERREGELGWIINKNYWGHGYAFEAAVAVRDFAFAELGLAKITACCDSRNTASFRLMERIGMHLEDDTGVRSNRANPGPAKELLYALDRGESFI